MPKKIYLQHTLHRILTIEKIVSIFYSDLSEHFNSHGERHDHWEFIYVDSGKLEVETDTEKFILEQGYICFHKPGEFHLHKALEGIRASICVVSFCCNSDCLSPLFQKHVLLPNYCQQLLSQILKHGALVFNAIVDNNKQCYLIRNENYPVYSEQMISGYLEIFLLEVISFSTAAVPPLPAAKHTGSTSENQKKELARQAIDYLTQNLFTDISIPQICSTLHCSKTTLSVAFKSYTNMSIIQYYNYLKIETAKDMLQTQNLNITQISELLNFCNINYFSNLFKKYTGLYPSEYARSIKIHNHINYVHSKKGKESF